MSTIRWTSGALAALGLYIAWTGERSWALFLFLAAVIAVFLWAITRTTPKRPVSNWLASDDPKYGELDQLIDADHKKDLS